MAVPRWFFNSFLLVQRNIQVITTTQGWHRPLDYGLYRLFPHGVRLISSNYPLQAEGRDRLVFQRTDFWPTEEWHFAWEVQ